MWKAFLGIAAGAAAVYVYLSDARLGHRSGPRCAPGWAASRAAPGRVRPGACAPATVALAQAVAAQPAAGNWGTDDAVLAQNVRSEALGTPAAAAAGITINAERGVVVLRGEVAPAAAIASPEAAVRRVAGGRASRGRERGGACPV